MWIFTYILFIFCSVFFIPKVPDEWLIPKNAIFAIGGLALIASSFYFKRIREFKDTWVSLIFVFLVLSFGINFYIPMIFPDSDGRIAWNVWNYHQSLNAFIGILLIKILFEYTDSLARWIVLAKILCWMGFLFGVYSILQFFGLEQIFTSENGWFVKTTEQNAYPENPLVVSFLGNSFFTGNYLSIISPLCLIFKEFRYKIFYVLILIAVVMTKSFLALITTWVGLMMYLILTKKIKWIIVVLFLMASFCFFKYKQNPQFFSGNGRMSFISMGIAEWKKNPVWGGGLGSFERANYIGNFKRIDNVHNEFVQFLPEGGIILFTLVMGYLTGLFKRILFVPSNILSIGFLASFIGYLVVCLGGFPLRVAPLAFLGIFLITFLEIHTKGEIYG